MRLRSLALITSLLAGSAWAEKALVNIHLEPGAGTGLNKSALVVGAALKVDTTVIKAICGNTFCLAPQIEFFGYGAMNRQYLHDGSMFGAGLGLRMRLFNDERGYLFNPGTKRTGNLWGNWYVDAHATLNETAMLSAGFDVSTGAELSLIEGLSIGPFAKLQWTSPYQLLVFGLSLTVGAPQTTPAEADYDGDGILGDNDKCIDEAEDKDGFEDGDGCVDKDDDKDGVEDVADMCKGEAEDKDGFRDEDGCPDLDNDGDGVNDKDDKCVDKPGVKENGGCPDTDKDGDTVVDRLDKCVDVKGLTENAGCPDTDKDGDTIVDRLDKCPDVKGELDNGGCPWPDADKDGVADRFDNCINEAGVAANQGCPESKKQAVAISAGKLELKDKVYFDNGKATIQKRSFPLLDQVAEILKAHPEFSKLQIEGHTDNVGKPDKNKKLSQDRANSVKDYLVKKGVEAERLTAVGFGDEKPMADNKTPAGREANRRVEFNAVK